MKKLTYLLAGALLVIVASCSAPQADKTNDAQAKNKEAMLKVMDMFSTGNIEGMENYVADNMVDHSPDPRVKSTGIQSLKDAIAMYRSSFPDLKMTSIAMVAEGDMVIHHFNMTGTNTGTMGEGMPATNKSVNVNGVDIVRFENGKGVEHWGYWEESKFMIQLGLMPDPAAMPPDSMKMAEGAKP